MSIQRRLREDLAIALLERNKTEAATIKTIIAAIENAEAVDTEERVDAAIAFRPDQPRRKLTEKEVRRILESGRAEVAEAAAHYRDLGVDDAAEELETRTRIVDRYLTRLP